MLTGNHLIAGDWIAHGETFTSAPVTGAAVTVSEATAGHIDRACRAAADAFQHFGRTGRAARAALLEAIAGEIDARGDAITETGSAETGLPAARLQGERGRTTGQLRLFARHIRSPDHLDRRHDAALPDRQPLPRPDLRLIQRPVGPVAVFGASNFPLAFSVAGGDTASALAAGCPVVVKGHPAHPGTCELVAQAIRAAVDAEGLPAGLFSLVQGAHHSVGSALVRHPVIKAVGFTGSLRGGRALFDLCAARPEPIPFFGELGSVNPMFVLPAALASRGDAIGTGWAGSLTLGVGQFCTSPGLAIVLESPEIEPFLATVRRDLGAVAAQTMLTDGIAAAFRTGRDRIGAINGVTALVAADADGRQAAPALFSTDGETWLANPALGEEVFGPLALVVRVRDIDQMIEIARAIEGQLTCTLQVDADDTALAQRLLPILETKAGRLLANGFPTGVEVCDAMVHGGPYPASTNFGATSVGSLAIRRWLRPVCYQNMPDALLPSELR